MRAEGPLGASRGLFAGLLDDAAVFPPGSLPLEEAVRAHLAHRRGPYADLVGPLVVPARDLGAVGALVAGRDGGEGGGADGRADERSPADALKVALTGPLEALVDALAQERPAALRVVGVEASLGPEESPAALDETELRRLAGAGVRVAVELPRDTRRDTVLRAVAAAGVTAKLRTGGVRADLHPDEAELAGALVAIVAAGLAFKATAGLHRAVRHTDPDTGFEQHGFLNVLLAVDAARRGAGPDALADVLAERDPGRVAAGAAGLPAAVRETFLSLGTCSVTEPVADLRVLGLLGAPGPLEASGSRGASAGAPA